jgi:hypothetical protein
MSAEFLALVDGLELLPAVGGFTDARFHAGNSTCNELRGQAISVDPCEKAG